MILPIGAEQYHQVNCIQHYYRSRGTTAQVTLKEQIKVMVQLQGGI